MRSHRSRAVRAAAYAALATVSVTALVALSAPAYADPSDDPSGPIEPSGDPSEPVDPPADSADLSIDVRSGDATQDSLSKFVSVIVKNDGPATATNVVAVISLDDVQQTPIFEPIGDDTDCEQEGSDFVFTCKLPDLKSGATNNDIVFNYQNLDADLGTVAEGTAEVSSDVEDPAGENNSAPFTLRIVEPGIDLSIWSADEITLNPGETAEFSGEDFLRVENESETATEGLGLSMVLPPYASFEKDYSDCTYTDDGRKLNCESEDWEIGPGTGGGADPVQALFTEETPLRITLAENAPGPLSLGRAQAVVTAFGELGDLPASGSDDSSLSTMDAPDLPNDNADGDNLAEFSVYSTDNPADLAIAAEPVAGQVGDTVEVEVVVTNKGPADSPGGSVVTFTPPKGTTVVTAPKGCEAVQDSDPPQFVCESDATVTVGSKGKTYTFPLKIDSKALENGEALVEGEHTDKDPKNNTTAVIVTIGGGGAGLPITGLSLTIAGLTAAALLAAGGAMLLAARKRRLVPAGAGIPEVAGESDVDVPAVDGADDDSGAESDGEPDEKPGESKD